MLHDIIPVSKTTESISSFSIISFVFTILVAFAELLNIIPHIKDIDAKQKKVP